MNRKWYEWILTLTYIAMVGLCVFLNFSKGHQESLASIIVNIVMFIIVAAIFLSADFGSFAPMNAIIKDLKFATEKIRKDAMNTRTYLWEPYSAGNIELFKSKHLQEIFRDFTFELNRENDAENSYYRPNIDDYINEELVDSVMHRNELNQVAGMLTGLGILGTFIGLSLGLQNFNTGTTAQMTESIEPLMNGIKVAFHTSIYGMVFSLVFNTIYKKKLYDAEESVAGFISAFKKYVLPDTSNDGMNQLIQMQEEQLDAINNISLSMTEELANMINPHLDRLHEEVVDFERMATRNQAEAMGKVVEYFVAQMNQSLSGTFRKLDQEVADMYQIQNNNANMVKNALDSVTRNTGSLSDVNKETEKLVSTLNNYSSGIQSVLDELQKTISILEAQDAASRDMLVKEKALLVDQQGVINSFKDSVDELAKATQKSGTDMERSLSEINDSLYFIRKTLEKQPTKPTRR